MLKFVMKRPLVCVRWILLTAVFVGLGMSPQRIIGPSEAAISITPKPRFPIDRNLLRDETTFQIYLTGYSWWDNTPRGSAAIAKPVVHRRAGGKGTYRDPITIAVGHKIQNGRQTMDFPAGTRFYLPSIQKYAIVEDVCGDGQRPQNGPCHTGHQGYFWLDIYIGGRTGSAQQANWCMRRITGLQNVIMNPRHGYTVNPGEIYLTTCLQV